MKKCIYVLSVVVAAALVASCDLEQALDVTSISLDKPSIEVNVGEDVQLTATVLPIYALNRTVSWKSSDESVATVSASGMVTGISEGTAVVSASSGAYSAYCNVNVVTPILSISQLYGIKDSVSVKMNPVIVQSKATLGLVVSDATGITYIHGSAGASAVNVGDEIRFNAVKSTYRQFPELINISDIEIISEGNSVNDYIPYDISDVTVINTEVAPFNDYSYCKMKGNLYRITPKTGGLSYDLSFDNISFSDNFAHLFYPADFQEGSLFYEEIKDIIYDGITIEFKGYYMGVSLNTGALFFMPTSMTWSKL